MLVIASCWWLHGSIDRWYIAYSIPGVEEVSHKRTRKQRWARNNDDTERTGRQVRRRRRYKTRPTRTYIPIASGEPRWQDSPPTIRLYSFLLESTIHSNFCRQWHLHPFPSSPMSLFLSQLLSHLTILHLFSPICLFDSSAKIDSKGPIIALRHSDDVWRPGNVVGSPADGQHVVSLLLAQIRNVVDVGLLLLVRQLLDRVAGRWNHRDRQQALTWNDARNKYTLTRRKWWVFLGKFFRLVTLQVLYMSMASTRHF